MNTNRLMLGLIVLIVVMQGVIVFRDPLSRSPIVRDPIIDPPDGIFLDLKDVNVEGDGGAKVVLVEFSDYECPFCARHANGVRQRLRQHFVMPGKIRYAFANNPLPIHPNANLLAAAAICAGEQGRFWEMNEAIFARAPRTRIAVLALTSNLRLDSTRLEHCIDNSSLPSDQIATNIAKARDLHLIGTPGFAVGQMERDRVRIKKLIRGAREFDVFERAISLVISEMLNETRSKIGM